MDTSLWKQGIAVRRIHHPSLRVHVEETRSRRVGSGRFRPRWHAQLSLVYHRRRFLSFKLVPSPYTEPAGSMPPLSVPSLHLSRAGNVLEAVVFEDATLPTVACREFDHAISEAKCVAWTLDHHHDDSTKS